MAGLELAPSLPADLDPVLLDLLRNDDGEDILGIDNLEWVLSNHQAPADGYVINPAQMPVPPPRTATSSAGSPELTSGWPSTAPVKSEPCISDGRMSNNTTEQQVSLFAGMAVTAAPAAAAPRAHAAPQARVSLSNLGSGSGDDEGAQQGGAGPSKKRRTRNQDQMQQNRVAQARYRERKKAEYEGLAAAVETLTAQLAAMKAIEVRAGELEAANVSLTAQVGAQGARINALEHAVAARDAALAAAQREAAEARAVAAQQATMILDQHNKLKLQEEVMEQLRGQLRATVEDAFGSQDPKTVCVRMCGAVRQALEGARDVEGLQEALAALPEHMITEICKSILCEVKRMWPELGRRWQALFPGTTWQACPQSCAQAAGPVCT